MSSFPKNLKTLRTRAGLTQDALAEALHVTRQTVSSWERGRSEPSLDTLSDIAAALNAPVEELIFGCRREPAPTLTPKALWVTGVSLTLAVTVLLLEIFLFPHLDFLRRQYYTPISFLYHQAVPQIGSFFFGVFLVSGFSLFRPFPIPGRWRIPLWVIGSLLTLPALLITLELTLASFFNDLFPVSLTYYLMLYCPDIIQELLLRLLPLLGGLLLRLGFERKI